MTPTFLPLSAALFYRPTIRHEFSLKFEIHHILAKEGVCRHGLIRQELYDGCVTSSRLNRLILLLLLHAHRLFSSSYSSFYFSTRPKAPIGPLNITSAICFLILCSHKQQYSLGVRRVSKRNILRGTEKKNAD